MTQLNDTPYMGRKVTLICGVVEGNREYLFFKAILDYEQWKYETIVDMGRTMTLTKGQGNPAGTAVLQWRDQTFTSPYEWISYLDSKGLRLC